MDKKKSSKIKAEAPGVSWAQLLEKDEPEHEKVRSPLEILSKHFPNWFEIKSELVDSFTLDNKEIESQEQVITKKPSIKGLSYFLLWILLMARKNRESFSQEGFLQFLVSNEFGDDFMLRNPESIINPVLSRCLSFKSGDEALSFKGTGATREWKISLELCELLKKKAGSPLESLPSNIEAPIIRQEGLFLEAIREKAYMESSSNIEELKENRIYLPDIYIPRQKFETHIKEFLSFENKRTGFLLIAPTGMGKTNILAHLIVELLEGSDITLFIPMKYMSLEQTTIKETVCEKLGVPMKFSQFLEEIDRSRRKEDRAECTRLILCIDGLNDIPEKMIEVHREISTIIRNFSKYDWLKVIYSFRDTMYEKAKKESGVVISMQSHFAIEQKRNDRLCYEIDFSTKRDVNDKENLSCEIYLEPLTDLEMEKAYNSYRKKKGMCPRSEFYDVPKDSKEIMRHPGHLRLIMESYDGEKIPSSTSLNKFFEKFCEKRVFDVERPHRREFINRLIDAMRKSKTTRLPEKVLQNDKNLREIHLQSSESYRQLRDDGVLERRKYKDSAAVILGKEEENFLRFVSDSLFEYLLSLRIEEECRQIESLVKLSVEAAEGDGYPSLERALVYNLRKFLQSGEFDIISCFLSEEDEVIARRIVKKIIIESFTWDPSGNTFSSAIDNISRQESSQSFLALYNIAFSLYGEDKTDFKILCLKKLVQIGDILLTQSLDYYDDNKIVEIVFKLADAKYKLAKHPQLIDSESEKYLQECTELYDAVYPDPDINWDAYISLGNIQRNKAWYRNAEKCYLKVIEYLQDEEIFCDLEDDDQRELLIACASLANLYDVWNKPDQAEEFREKMWEMQGRLKEKYYTSDRSYYNIGCQFGENGCIKEAEACFVKAINIIVSQRSEDEDVSLGSLEMYYSQLGRLLYHSSGRLEKAEEYLRSSIRSYIASLKRLLLDEYPDRRMTRTYKNFLFFWGGAQIFNDVDNSFEKLSELALHYWNVHLKTIRKNKNAGLLLEKSIDLCEFLIDNNYLPLEKKYGWIGRSSEKSDDSQYESIKKLLHEIIRKYPKELRAKALFEKLELSAVN